VIKGNGGDDFQRDELFALGDSGIGLLQRPFETEAARQFVAADDLEFGADRAVLNERDLRVARAADAAVPRRADVVPAVADLAVEPELIEPRIDAPAAQVGQPERSIRVDIQPDQSVRGGERADGQRIETADEILRRPDFDGIPAAGAEFRRTDHRVNIVLAIVLPVEIASLVVPHRLDLVRNLEPLFVVKPETVQMLVAERFRLPFRIAVGGVGRERKFQFDRPADRARQRVEDAQRVTAVGSGGGVFRCRGEILP